jgi:methionine sulfoxide reductase heme-binding subunit
MTNNLRGPLSLHIALVLLCLVPAGRLAWGLVSGDLGPNPVDTLTKETGTWALRLLLASLAVTPLRRLTGSYGIIRYRRTLGLLAFFYAVLHAGTWSVFDHALDLEHLIADVVRRPFITVGFTAFVLMVPLAATSTAGMIRRIGGRRWQHLHRLVYVCAAAGVVHYYWLVKADTTAPFRYAIVLVALLGLRVGFWLGERNKRLAKEGRARTPHGRG